MNTTCLIDTTASASTSSLNSHHRCHISSHLFPDHTHCPLHPRIDQHHHQTSQHRLPSDRPSLQHHLERPRHPERHCPIPARYLVEYPRLLGLCCQSSGRRCRGRCRRRIRLGLCHSRSFARLGFCRSRSSARRGSRHGPNLVLVIDVSFILYTHGRR